MFSTTPYLPPEPDRDADWFADDPVLRRLLMRRLSPPQWQALEPRLAKLGQDAPRRLDALARRADAHGPRLDGQTIVFDESYRALQRAAREHESFTYHWLHEGAPRLATLALGYLYAQAECGYYCPACMTDGAAYVLSRYGPQELRAWALPRLTQRDPEGAFEGAMFLTERRGGSDVGGATETRGERDADGSWRLHGAKWFCSNANAEIILALARLPDGAAGTRGLGLFLLPRTLPNGAVNDGIVVQKLKEKLGVRSMATGEIELRGARAFLLEGEGAGFLAMAEMVNVSRLYNAIASVAIARRALREGQRNALWRRAFGKRLAEQPLYVRGLAELANDVRGALLLSFDAVNALDREDRPLLRALTPLAKAGTGRLAVEAASAACEMLGGNGYVEEWVTPRLLRDAQVLPIWEGTTNVQALDLLRAATKERALEALVTDSVRRGPEFAEGWRALAGEAVGEVAALRFLFRCYHLRAATLLAEDAREGDPEAAAHAQAYALRHVRRDERGIEALLLEQGRLLAGLASG
jgi:alkylation response protein AidB-like acyl-CoA dehydrogenase